MREKIIPLSVPNLKGNELKYVSEAIQSEWVSTGGPFIEAFEKKIADYCNCNGAVACQNGTSGLHIALKVCGVSKSHEVIVPALTFIAAVNPIKYLDAEPIFIDCDSNLTINPNDLKLFLTEECIFEENKVINKRSGRQIKAIIVVHVFGNLAEMEELCLIAKKFGLKIIEDATEAIGSYYIQGKYKGKHAGTIGDIGVYSFNGNKIITTGGGGMIVSDDLELLKKARHLTTQAKSDELYYTHDEIGYNYRMTNLQAALGLAQLEQLEDFIKTKQINYVHFQNAIKNIKGLDILNFREGTRPNYWFYALHINKEYPLNRDQLIVYLQEKGIQTRPIWGLINEQVPYLNNQAYHIVNAFEYWKNIINIPCSSNLKDEEVKYIVEELKKITLIE